jgi:hypothetical protein
LLCDERVLTETPTSHNLFITGGEDNRVLIAGAGKPVHKDWEGVFEGAYKAIEEWGAKANFSPKETSHMRGDFPQVIVGIAHGNGRTKAMNMTHTVHKTMLDELLKDRNIIRIASFASGKLLLFVQFFD